MFLFWSCREIGGASVLATSIFQSWSNHVTWPWEIPRIHNIHMIICIDCYSYCKPSNHLRNLRSIHRISENFISHWPPLHPMILQNYGNLFMIVMANNYPLTNVYKKLWKINENHHSLWVKWPFSIAFCTLTRGYSRFTLVNPLVNPQESSGIQDSIPALDPEDFVCLPEGIIQLATRIHHRSQLTLSTTSSRRLSGSGLWATQLLLRRTSVGSSKRWWVW